MADAADKEVGWEDGHSRPPALIGVGMLEQPVDQESPSIQSPLARTTQGADKKTGSFRKKKKMNIENLLEVMDNAHSALATVLDGSSRENLAEVSSEPSSSETEERHAIIRSAAEGLSWWVKKMRDTNAKSPFVPSPAHRQNSTPRSNAGLDDFMEQCDKLKMKSPERNANSPLAAGPRHTAFGVADSLPEDAGEVEMPQRRNPPSKDLEATINALLKEKDDLRQAHLEEVKQREHYKQLSSTLVDKMASVLDTLKREHQGKMKKAREQLAYMEVENERYLRMYQAELEIRFEYQDELDRLQQDVAYLRKKTSGCGAQCESTVVACGDSVWAFILWILAFFNSRSQLSEKPPSTPPKRTARI